MAIKKRPVSPRQKMINLMYVILMAMLALNTPTDEEFGVKGKSVVEKIPMMGRNRMRRRKI